MIGVNSLHSAGRLRSRSLCTVRYGRDFRMMDPFRYPRTPRSRSLKPLVFPDLMGKAQDGKNHPQARKRRKVHRTDRSVSPVDFLQVTNVLLVGIRRMHLSLLSLDTCHNKLYLK